MGPSNIQRLYATSFYESYVLFLSHIRATVFKSFLLWLSHFRAHPIASLPLCTFPLTCRLPLPLPPLVYVSLAPDPPSVI